MAKYAVTLEPDTNGTYLVGFPDLPAVNSVGDSVEEALKEALDALETGFEMYRDTNKAIPLPRAGSPEGAYIEVPGLVMAKVYLWNAMWDERITKTELARRIGAHLPQVDRLLDIRHQSKFGAVEEALAAVGKHIDVVLA